jgi:outer membrane protein assembly factor BamB
MMLKRLLLLCSTLALVSVSWAEIKPFTFVHISDTHIPGKGHSAFLMQCLNDAKKNWPEAEFVINTGDVTEFGYVEEFTSYTEVIARSPIKVYQVMGNHDARWSENGKENFKKYCGPTFVQFDHNGMRFFLMDVSMLIEQYGHFDGQQIKMLEAGLKDMPHDMPAALAMHHPPLSDGHYIDNEYEFTELLRAHYVPLVLDGHGHSFPRWEYNNTTYAMGGATSTGAPPRSYRVYKVTPEKIECFRRVVIGDKTTTEAPIMLSRERSKVGNLEEVADASTEGKRTFRLAASDKVEGVMGVYTLDKYLTGTMALANDQAELDTSKLNAGRHQLVLEFSDDRKSTEIRTVYFTNEVATSPKLMREFKLGSGVQSHPTVDGDVLYVGSNNGFLRAFDLNTSEQIWEQNLQREILSAPVVTTSTVFAGSLDSHLYALNKTDGSIMWKFKTGAAVMATPLVTTGTVFVGSGDYNLYAIDEHSGEEKWRFQTGKLVKMTPAHAGGKLFFGSWDGIFYCVDAETGKEVWKIPAAISGHFSAATFNPIAFNDKILVTTHDYSVRCLEQTNGAHNWMYKPVKDELGPSYSSAVTTGGVAYMGSINGHLVGHHLETGQKVFDVNLRPEKTDPVFDSLPVLHNNRIYVGTVGGNVYCVNILTESVEWSVALQPGYIFTRPAIWKDRLLLGSLNNRVYEIGPISGPDTAAEVQPVASSGKAKRREARKAKRRGGQRRAR